MGLLICVFLAVAFISSWRTVSAYTWDVQPAIAVAGFLVIVLVYAANGLGYALIVERLADARSDRLQQTAIWARSMLARYVPGNVMMLATRIVLGREAGVARKVTVAATVYEQLLNVGACAIASLVLVVAENAPAGGLATASLAAIPVGLLALHPRIFGPVSSWGLRRIGREPLPVLLSERQLLGLLAWYLVAALAFGLGVWMLVVAAVGSDAGSPAYVGLSFLASFVLSMLAFIFPSGLGIREGLFAVALARDLPRGVAIAISAGMRLVLTAAELTFVGLAVYADRRLRRRRGRGVPAPPQLGSASRQRAGAGDDEEAEIAGVAPDEE